MTAPTTLRVRRDGAVATVTLCRPERRNALNAVMAEELFGVLRDLERDAGVRSVVLTGEGDHFCAGADLAGLEEAGVTDHAVRFFDWSRQNFGPCIEALQAFPKPVVAGVVGVCVGVAWNLALSCDLVVAGESARFSQIFVRRGLVPDGGGTWLLPRHVGLMRARELTYTGRFVGAAEALQLGVVVRVVPDEDVGGAVDELARELAAAPTRALQFTKALLNRSHEVGFRDAVVSELAYQGLLSQTHDVAEGVASFLEKRDPRYIGD